MGIKLLKTVALTIIGIGVMACFWHYFSYIAAPEAQIYVDILLLMLGIVLFVTVRNLEKKNLHDAPKTIGETLIHKRLKIMEALSQQETETKEYDSLRKVKKFKFTAKQIENIKPVKVENKGKKEEIRESSLKKKLYLPNDGVLNLQINFKALEEFEWILPTIEGTFLDFKKSLLKFTDILAIFVTDEEEEEITRLLRESQYVKLVDILEKQAYGHQKQASVASLLESQMIRYLQYGRHLCPREELSKFWVTEENLKLYKEIQCLLQELFVKYTNEKYKLKCNSVQDFLDNDLWNEIEKAEFTKNVEQLGKDVLTLLLEDFLSSLKPVKRKNILQYHHFRNALRNSNAQEPLEVGYIFFVIIKIIRDTCQKIKENIVVQTPQEIDQLVKASQIKPSESQPKVELSESDLEEKRLTDTIFEISKFLAWFPQDITLLTKEDRELIEYFDKILYSRRSRLAIIKDTEKKKEGLLFEERFKQVMKKISKSEEVLEEKKKWYNGNIIGTEIEIIAPRQCQDYFPWKGVIENIIKSPFESSNVIQLEVREHSNLRSFVVFTGNNVVFARSKENQ